MSALVRYEEMRVAVERCARIDEASDIRDKAAALQAYARQRDDEDLQVWTAEIKLRASVRIGELVRELDTAQGVRTELLPDSRNKLKSAAIEAAGLSKSTAYDYQELAGPREDQAQKAGKAAAEKYFAQSRADRKPSTMQGLRGAVKEAVHATLGPKPQPKPKAAPAPLETPKFTQAHMNAWTDWVSAVKHLACAETDLAAISGTIPDFTERFIDEALLAQPRLVEWINQLEQFNAARKSAA